MLSRAGWTVAVLAVVSIGLLAPDARSLVTDVSGPRFPDSLVALGCLVQLALSSWVVLVVLMSLAHAPAALMQVVAPRVLRRALFAGAASVLALSPAHADRSTVPRQPPAHDVVGLRLPDRPVATRSRAVVQPRAVVVRPGDTLWVIAARHLPAGATDADITVACQDWHAANRAVIGADPNLIFPAQRLAPPLGKDPT